MKVFLTQVGGGAFGNRSLWILRATGALKKFEEAPLDVYLVHYSTIPPGRYQELEIKKQKTSEVKEESKVHGNEMTYNVCDLQLLSYGTLL